MRTGIFIDGSTLLFFQNNERIDFQKFSEWLSFGNEITHKGYYNSMYVTDSKKGFLGHLYHSGYSIKITKMTINHDKEINTTNGIPTSLTIDVMKNFDNCDKFVFVTGNSEYEPLAHYLVSKGKSVVFVTSPNSFHNLLKQYDYMSVNLFLEKKQGIKKWN